MTRQAQYQRKRREQGLCIACGAPAEGGCHCPKCRRKVRLRNRKRNGCEAWKPGRMGRPPIGSNYTKPPEFTFRAAKSPEVFYRQILEQVAERKGQRRSKEQRMAEAALRFWDERS